MRKNTDRTSWIAAALIGLGLSGYVPGLEGTTRAQPAAADQAALRALPSGALSADDPLLQQPMSAK